MEDARFEAIVESYEQLRKSSSKNLTALATGHCILGAVFLGALFSVTLAAFVLSAGALAGLWQWAIPAWASVVILVYSAGVLSVTPDMLKSEPVQEEYILEAEKFPGLFGAIARLGGGALADVALVPEPRIYLRSTLKNGILCGVRYRLLVGYAACQSLPTAYFDAILAHEIGHLKSSLSSLLVFELALHRSVMGLLVGDGDEEAAGSFKTMIHTVFLCPFLILFRRYSERLRALNIVLNRQLELDADRYAAEQCGAREFVTALLFLMTYLELFETEFVKSKDDGEASIDSPCAHLFTRWRLVRQEMIHHEKITAFLKRKLNEPLKLSRHPGLRERLSAALGQDVSFFELIDEIIAEGMAKAPDAVESYFGFAGDNFLEQEMNRRYS